MNKGLYMCVRVCVNVIISGFETACRLSTGKRRRFMSLLQRWGFKILTENQVPYVSDYRSRSITIISRHIAHAWVRPPPPPPPPHPRILSAKFLYRGWLYFCFRSVSVASQIIFLAVSIFQTLSCRRLATRALYSPNLMLSISTLPTKEINQGLWASWFLVGGWLQGDKLALASAHSPLQYLSSMHRSWVMCQDYTI